MELPTSNYQQKIETSRFGPFRLQLGIDSTILETLCLRVTDAHQRFKSSPLAQVANQLEKEVVVSSIFGTNSIEGGTLTEEETRLALELTPSQVQDIEEQRALNLKHAYQLSRNAASDQQFKIDLSFIKEVHAAITQDLPHQYNRPGQLRNNAKQTVTSVGDSTHGGRYKPPQFNGDIETLLRGLLNWHDELATNGVPALIRAPLIHYYFELIHPFWDGNGRVGRVIEATLLQQAGFRYAPLTQARYYFQHIDQYFPLFNHCRKASDKGQDHPNTTFVSFFLEGMLESLNRLHQRVNQLVIALLFEADIKRRFDTKEINQRQYAIISQVMQVMQVRNPLPLETLRQSPSYLALYDRLSSKTKQRDLNKLLQLQLIKQDEEKRLSPGFDLPTDK